ncbi:hypothetical protein ACPV5R_18635 [Vibrio astriarenae]
MYQLVDAFLCSAERRDEKMKSVPFYFIGSALGLGALASSEVVQNTVLGFDNDVLMIDDAFVLD